MKTKNPTVAAAPTKRAATQAKPSSPDRVVAAINRGIMTRRYGPGHRLIEADLAASLGVSRSTIREALKQLAIQGVVRINPHRGAEIRPLGRPEAENLVQVLEVLCGLAARLAAERIHDHGERQRFQKAAEALSTDAGDAGNDQFLAARGVYYEIMFSIAQNPELSRLMPVSQIHLFRSQFQRYLKSRDIADMRKEYREISDAILAGNADSAETRMRRHMRRTINRLDTIDTEAFL